MFPTRSVTNRAVQSLNMARGLKFRIQKVEGLYYLICVFVFAYAKSLFSHDAAHMIVPKNIFGLQKCKALSEFCYFLLLLFFCLFDLLLYVYGKQLRSCQDSPLLKNTVPGQASRKQLTSI